MTKDFIKIDPREGATKAYIFDKRSNIKSAISEMLTSGQIAEISTQIEGDLPYNNGNGLISPGEIVGISLNVYNDSNVEMGGVQILANDWDHVNTDSSDEYYGSPCSIEDFPDINAGGTTSGDCDSITTDNGDGTDKVSSVCLVQYFGDNTTSWITQETFMEEINFNSNNCLSDSTTENCFVRAISGADYAFYSRIDPNSTWAETFSGEENDDSQEDDDSIFHFSNLLFFEINSWVPQGTVFQCRVRARFSNCSDCFTDSNNGNDNYTDDYYSSEIPFKLIYFQFQVVN